MVLRRTAQFINRVLSPSRNQWNEVKPILITILGLTFGLDLAIAETRWDVSRDFIQSPLCQSQTLRAMRSEGAGGQAFFIDEVWHGYLVPGESCCGRFGDGVAGNNDGVAVDHGLGLDEISVLARDFKPVEGVRRARRARFRYG